MQLQFPSELPISAHREELIEAIQKNRVVIVAGDTGSGKTTQIPKLCLAAGRGRKKMIGCTQPRRIAAVSIAEKVGNEMQSPSTVGYKIRFRDKTGPDCRIKFMTDGVLLAETRQDRFLQKYDTLIVDEAHERSLNIDFLLGYLHQLLEKSSDLKLIIASATIDTEKFSKHFADAPVVSVSGRTYPIAFHYAEDCEENYVAAAIRETVALCDASQYGDVLVFMPTERDIRDTIQGLEKLIGDQYTILPLFGRLQSRDQRKIFKIGSKRKIIVSTNVAETSVTVPRIHFVVDTGLARISRYNPVAGTTSLRVEKISQASCNQRAGRCGRIAPGTCIRLFSEEDYMSRSEYTLPEIQRSNLASVILQMKSLSLGDPRNFPFIDKPIGRALHNGERTLKELGALSQHNKLTRTGRVMASLPIDPPISRIIIEGARLGALTEIKIIASALAIQDPRVRPAEQENKADQAHARFTDKQSDFMSLLAIWQTYHNVSDQVSSASKLRKFCNTHFLSWQRMREWFDIHEQLGRILKTNKGFSENKQPAEYATIHQALSCGFLRNIATKKKKNIYTGSGGREVMLFPGSCLFDRGPQWIIAGEFMETSRLFARNVATIDVKWLEKIGGDLCHRSWSDPHFEKKSGQVVAFEKVTLFGLPIVAGRRVNYGRINEKTKKEAQSIFIEQALIEGQLGGSYDFLQHNQNLLAELAGFEDRFRKPGFTVEEQLVREFYEQRLGSVHDRFTLNRLLKRKKGSKFLFMDRDELCREAPSSDELYRFPEFVSTNAGTLQLHYRFEPGHKEDGVTLSVPLALSQNLNPTQFEWLVPGLLEEKIFHLLKKLPKKLRKHLVPLPETTTLLMDAMEYGKGSLYEALEKAILRTRQVSIRRSDWQADTLPVHLKMRFVVISDRGEKIAETRSFLELEQQKIPETSAQPKRKTLNKAPLEKSGITGWDFADVPAYLQREEREQYLFPALFPDETKRCLSLRYVDNEQTSIRQNRYGLAYLYGLSFSKEIKLLRKECKATLTSHSASWLALEWQPEKKKRDQALCDFIVKNIFKTHSGIIPDRRTYNAVIDEVRKNSLNRSARKILDSVTELLRQRRTVQMQLLEWQNRFGAPTKNSAFNSFQKQLDTILPSNFLVSRTFDSLKHCQRYLKALSLRIERAQYSPDKDHNKAQRLQKALDRLEKIDTFTGHSSICCNLMEEYKTMIAEFHVSIFAPELGTSMPVSEKRLAKKWQELEDQCRRVE